MQWRVSRASGGGDSDGNKRRMSPADKSRYGTEANPLQIICGNGKP